MLKKSIYDISKPKKVFTIKSKLCFYLNSLTYTLQYYRLFFDKSNKQSIKLETAVT